MCGLKAFACTEDDESTGAVLFATHDIAAKRWAANEYADGDITRIQCRRAKWADHLVGSAVPASLMIEHGWHFECSGCGARIDLSELDEKGLTVAGVIGMQDDLVFCGPECALWYRSRRATAKRLEAEAIMWLRGIALRSIGTVEFVTGFGQEHAYASERGGRWTIEQAFVSFRFDGMEIGTASLRYHGPRWCGAHGPTRPEWSCCAGDKEAFEAFAKARQTREAA
ncbi:hypothetical protein SAMN05216548_10740 [Faunimonas pinastri]|uniref:Uncharacterized protein n=2 Tax=Faunimonas pinastri TaxID=1855383 RepID=A0A1H9IAR6_9HYPH|nr:hypothetical protein SAMN05216548_10740 [Faunimonas pinastri]